MIKKAVLILVLALVALPATWRFVLRFLASGKMPASTQESEEELASESDPVVVVCTGYADLEGGITSLYPSQSGRVAEILVRENDKVAANAVLLRLDDRTARCRVAEARGVLDKALAQLAKVAKAPEQHRVKLAQQEAALKVARQRIAVARQTLAARRAQQKTERIGRIRDDPVLVEEVASAGERLKEFLAAEEIEVQRLNGMALQDPQADIANAKAEVATMRARLLEAEQVLQEHALRSPQAGRVLRVFVTPGEMLNPQKKTAIQFCPDSPRVIRAEVEQVFALSVEVGQPAVVEDEGRSGKTWRGRVMRLSDWYTQRRLVAEEQLQLKDVRTLECLIALDPGQAPLRIGQRVRVTISKEEPEDKAGRPGKADPPGPGPDRPGKKRGD
jgi:multidrug resistance efflux pump